jgi:hypothetical protein
MALRAIDVTETPARTRRAATAPSTGALRTPSLAPPRVATITELRPASRGVALAAARRERRRWLVLGALAFSAPLFACVGVLEVVR